MSGRTQEATAAASPELVLAQLDDLPTLPAVAVRLLQATSQDAAARDIAELVRADQSLSARLLSLANSAAFGARHEISSVDQAIVRLGFKTVRSVVLATKVFACFGSSGNSNGPHFELTEFWKHALAVACAARRLSEAETLRSVDAETAFVAGLLHDLGKAALHCVYPRGYDRVAAQADETRGDIADCERGLLGTDHTVAGRRIAQRWGLPRELQDVIWLHHLSGDALPTSVRNRPLISLVHLADVIAREQRVGYSGNHLILESSAQLATPLGIAPEVLETICAKLVGDVAHHVGLLGLGCDTPEGLYIRSLSAANTELGRLNTELAAGQRRAAAGARYFRALSEFDRRLDARLESACVAEALLEAARLAVPSEHCLAFAVQDGAGGVELAWRGGSSSEVSASAERIESEVRQWLQGGAAALDSRPVLLPLQARALAAVAMPHLGNGDFWLLPIVQHGMLVGGVIYPSQRDEASVFADESEELRSFMNSLGLAISRANAHAATTRLTEDLAQTNRRLQHAQAEVLRNRTLSMIAEMAAGAGHELNGPLTVISGRAQMLRATLTDPEMQRALDLIHTKAHECSRIVTDLMDFARPRPPQPEQVDLASFVTQTRQHCLDQLNLPASRLVIENPGPNGALSLNIDPSQLRTVLLELVRNAVVATQDQGNAITISWRDASLATTGETGASVPQRAVELVVRDQGIGMSAAVLQRRRL